MTQEELERAAQLYEDAAAGLERALTGKARLPGD